MFCNHLVLSWSHPFKLQGEAWNKYCISIYMHDYWMNITFTKRGFKGIFLLLQNVDLSSPRTPSVKAWPWNWAKVVAADHLVVTKLFCCKCFVVTKWFAVTKSFVVAKSFIVIVVMTTWFTPDGVWKARGCIWLTPLLSHKMRAIEDFLTWRQIVWGTQALLTIRKYGIS